MKKLIASVLSLAFVLALTCCAVKPDGKLTLEKVKELAEKGEELSWSDFEPYGCEDIGFGLYIYRYDIDEHYYLIIGGGSIQEPPQYIRLIYGINDIESIDDGGSIDIRAESVDDFIRGHK